MGEVYKRGSKWYIDYTVAEKRVRQSIGGTDVLTKRDAEKILIERERQDRLAQDGLAPTDCFISALRDSYEAFAKQTLRPAAFRRASTALENILRYLSVVKVSEITPDRVIAFREWRLAQPVLGKKPTAEAEETKQQPRRTYSRRSVNLEVGALATMLNHGVKQRMLSANPIRGLKPLKNERPYKERRPLTLEEIHAILAAATDHYRPVWRALLSTGMRISELSGLRLKDVDWDTREFIVRGYTAKNHHERRIPIEDAEVWSDLLHRRATAHLRQPGKGSTPKLTAQIQAKFTREHVYVTQANTPLGSNVRDRFYETCARAGVDVSGLEDGQGNAVDLHALRGTFATHAAQSGADIAALGEVTGHKDISVLLGHYLKAMAHTKRRAVASLPWVNGTLDSPASVVAIDRHNRGTTTRIATQKVTSAKVG